MIVIKILLDFILEKEFIPVDYRPVIVSFFKHSVSTYMEDYFERIYKQKNQKSFTFAVNLPKPEFEKDIIRLCDKRFSVVFSTYDYETIMVFYNSFLQQKRVDFPLPSNSMQLNNVKTLIDKPVRNNELLVKFKSPLVVREHDRETNKDLYLDFSNDGFVQKLKAIILTQASNLNFLNVDCSSFELEPVLPKRTVVTAFKNRINCSLGVFKLKGDIRLLDYLYNSGMGSRRSQGFGMFDIIS